MVKKTIVFTIGIIFLFVVFVGCNNTESAPENSQEEGPFTNDNWNDYANNVPVKIDDDILQSCYRYTDSLGYEIKEKEKYKSVLLGESNVTYVAVADDVNRDMLDKDDYLIIFQEIKIVIDADTGIVLGTIPYV